MRLLLLGGPRFLGRAVTDVALAAGHEVTFFNRGRTNSELYPEVERLALLHRLGHLELSEASVLVVASSPHRAEAFEAARFAIDTLKETVPIWKQEHWDGGTAWSEAAHDVRPVRELRPA